jgi:hypothetical protein
LPFYIHSLLRDVLHSDDETMVLFWDSLMPIVWSRPPTPLQNFMQAELDHFNSLGSRTMVSHHRIGIQHPQLLLNISSYS